MIEDAHRVPVESLDRARSGESAQRIGGLDLAHARRDNVHALTKSSAKPALATIRRSIAFGKARIKICLQSTDEG
jgi:hypothetical protein